MRKLAIIAALVFAALALGTPAASAGVLPGPVHGTNLGRTALPGPVHGTHLGAPPVKSNPLPPVLRHHHRKAVAAALPTTLAFTGTNTAAYLALSGGLLFAGGVLFRLGRRQPLHRAA